VIHPANSVKEGPVRTAPALLSALAVAAVVVTSLVGCASSGSSASAACTPSFSSGASSTSVTTTATTATFPTPLVVPSSQLSVNKSGAGEAAQSGDQVDYTFDIYSGATGQQIGSATTPQRAGAVDNSRATSIVRALVCAKPGERLTLVTTLKDSFGAGAGTNAGLSDSDTLVIVITVKDRFLGKADGVNVLPQDGMPSVVTAVDGQPGLVIQELAKPTTLRIETVKAGSGAVVKKNSTVYVKYSGWTWPVTSSDKPEIWPGGGQSSDGSTVPDGHSTWTNDKASDITVSSTAIPVGLYKALLGAKVGSQVLAVIPPKDGFGASSTTFGFAATDTVVMVIDVLGIK
jgi:hypothetical protein